MTGCLLALDKIWEFIPLALVTLGAGYLLSAFFRFAGPAATEACGVDQLCAGLSTGIEGAVHLMQHACLGCPPCF